MPCWPDRVDTNIATVTWGASACRWRAHALTNMMGGSSKHPHTLGTTLYEKTTMACAAASEHTPHGAALAWATGLKAAAVTAGLDVEKTSTKAHLRKCTAGPGQLAPTQQCCPKIWESNTFLRSESLLQSSHHTCSPHSTAMGWAHCNGARTQVGALAPASLQASRLGQHNFTQHSPGTHTCTVSTAASTPLVTHTTPQLFWRHTCPPAVPNTYVQPTCAAPHRLPALLPQDPSTGEGACKCAN